MEVLSMSKSKKDSKIIKTNRPATAMEKTNTNDTPKINTNTAVA
jgi:hypothetical protein